MYKKEGMCIVAAELCDKQVIKEEEMHTIYRVLILNKPSRGSFVYFLLGIRNSAYWWRLSRRGYIWRKIFLLGLIIKYSLKDE